MTPEPDPHTGQVHQNQAMPLTSTQPIRDPHEVMQPGEVVDVAGLEGQLAHANEQISELEVSLEACQRQLDTARAKISTDETVIANLKAELAAKTKVSNAPAHESIGEEIKENVEAAAEGLGNAIEEAKFGGED
jgi:hypothetical protein